MVETVFPVDRFEHIETPFYYYDLSLLRQTLQHIMDLDLPDNFRIHYAVKANANPAILDEIQGSGFGADCVSGGEIQAVVESGFDPDKILFAGVGKSDKEINLALDHEIACFNVESLQELEVIDELAAQKNKIAQIALRINPNVDADTHKYITTGLDENKFGIGLKEIPEAVRLLNRLKHVEFIGIHLHVGSQIMDMKPFRKLCQRVGELQLLFEEEGMEVRSINVGGGLGVDYDNPNENPIPDFENYFSVFRENLTLRENQTLHFELGRALVAQCGSLISRILYIKTSGDYKFAVLDAGMTDLIRPALYQAFHRIDNLSSAEATQEKYNVVGPICESSDTFAENYKMPISRRGDLVALRTAGAYGEIMASRYNLRELPKAYSSDDLLEK